MHLPKSKKRIFEVAKLLFWKYGIRKVTVEDICTQAKISKMTFYRHFNNKNEVAAFVLQQLIDEGMGQYFEIMRLEIAYSEKIRKLIKYKHENASGMSLEFLRDIYQNNDSGLREMFDNHTRNALKLLENDLTEAQNKGWIRNDLKISFIIYMLNSLNQKMSDPEFLAFFDSSEDAITELSSFFFYGILPNS